MIKVSPETIMQMESQQMGITVQIEFYEKMVLPTCPNCGSKETATVNVGITGRTISLAAATSKFHLRANGRPGDYYCNICQNYFSDHDEIKSSPSECSPIPKYGKLYYDTGELKYEGYYRECGSNTHQPYGHGVMYYKDGSIWKEGFFGELGLREGREYYSFGQLRFEGTYGIIDHVHLFPAQGRCFLEDGTLAYEGEFKVEKDQQRSWKIVNPENYGPAFLAAYLPQDSSILYGKLFYDTGEVYYEGYYTLLGQDSTHHRPSGKGILYYKDGKTYKEGVFELGGLSEGRIYYPSGQLKFEGVFNSKKGTSYYGPTYPVRGKFWLKNGTLAYEGEFKVIRQGSVGFPQVVVPENFGSLD